MKKDHDSKAGEQEEENSDSPTELEEQLAEREGWGCGPDGSEIGEGESDEDGWGSKLTIPVDSTPAIGIEQFTVESESLNGSVEWSDSEDHDATKLVTDISEREVAGKALKDSVAQMRKLAAQLGPKESFAMKSFFIGTAKSLFDGEEKSMTRWKRKNSVKRARAANGGSESDLHLGEDGPTGVNSLCDEMVTGSEVALLEGRGDGANSPLNRGQSGAAASLGGEELGGAPSGDANLHNKGKLGLRGEEQCMPNTSNPNSRGTIGETGLRTVAGVTAVVGQLSPNSEREREEEGVALQAENASLGGVIMVANAGDAKAVSKEAAVSVSTTAQASPPDQQRDGGDAEGAQVNATSEG